MPAYQPRLGGTRISEAYAEAMASAPITRVMLACYELNHSLFIDTAGNLEAIRFVNDYVPLLAQLEAGAYLNANTYVVFESLPVTVNGLKEGDSGETQMVSISIDGVSGEIAKQLNYAIGSTEPVYLTERIYASDDLTGPARLPVLRMILRNVQVTETTVSADATFFDAANNTFPRTEYTTAEYPGLSVR